MAKQVWKFAPERMNDEGDFFVWMPHGAEILLVGHQRGVFHIWALVDPAAAKVEHRYCLRGTGHDVPAGARHVQSFMQNDGEFIWHLFAPRGEAS